MKNTFVPKHVVLQFKRSISNLRRFARDGTGWNWKSVIWVVRFSGNKMKRIRNWEAYGERRRRRYNPNLNYMKRFSIPRSFFLFFTFIVMILIYNTSGQRHYHYLSLLIFSTFSPGTKPARAFHSIFRVVWKRLKFHSPPRHACERSGTDRNAT